MAEKKQTYAQYVKNLSSVRVTMLSLLSGFTFTTITLLLKELPDPSSTISNIALLFLTIIFDLLLFLLGWQIYIVIGLQEVRDPPSHSRWELSAFNGILLLVFYMWGRITGTDLPNLEPERPRHHFRYRMGSASHCFIVHWKTYDATARMVCER